MPFPFSYHRKIEWGRGSSCDLSAIGSALALELEAAGLKDVEVSRGSIKFRGSVLEKKIFAYGSVFADVRGGEIHVLERNGQLTILYRLKLLTKQTLGLLAFIAVLSVSASTGSITALVCATVCFAALCLLFLGLDHLHTVRDFNHLIRGTLRDLRKEPSPGGLRARPNPLSISH